MSSQAPCEYFSLRVMVRVLQEHEARWFFQQLIIALDYAHRMNVVSRDIKLENTLLDGSRRPLLKICDFGYSKNTEKDSVPKSRVGTPGYTGACTLPLPHPPSRALSSAEASIAARCTLANIVRCWQVITCQEGRAWPSRWESCRVVYSACLPATNGQAHRGVCLHDVRLASTYRLS